jgi:DNA-binding NtrC family response regulator
VDDEKDLRALLELKITRLGYAVITAETLADARNILRTVPVRMVLADLFLSQESGLELLHEVKRGHPNLPFVFLTGANEDDLSPAILNVLTKYANDFLRKPLSSQQLRETLEKYCG